MQPEIEIIVPEESRAAVMDDFADIPRARVVTAPSRARRASRICMATTRAFEWPESDMAGWLSEVQRLAGDKVPFIIRWSAIPKERNWAAFQNVATVAAQLRLAILVAHDKATARRLVHARLQRAEDKLIAAAELKGRVLEVWSCEPMLYRVPLEKLPPLDSLSPHELRSFSVSDSGSRLHWDSGDIDLNLDGIRAAVDIRVRREQQRRFREESEGYGHAIERFRIERALKQTDFPGLPERTVRRIEKGETLPRESTLDRLASGHGLSTSSYMKELARRVGTPRRSH